MKTKPTLVKIREQVAAYTEVAPRYAQLATTLEDILKKAVKSRAPLAIVQSRPKAIPSFAEKITRKWEGLETDDPVTEFTDLCGARVITLIRSHEKAMCQFLEENFTIDWPNCVNAIERLRPNEFGYLSKHYIVSLRPDVFPNDDIPVEIPDELYPEPGCPMKAEIQVRTILEHAFADVTHDMTYKSSFDVPKKWQREIAGVAAALETTANEMEDIVEGLEYYSANYGQAMTVEETRGEIENLKTVLEFDPGNAKLADRIAKLAITIEDWDTVFAVLETHLNKGVPSVWREYGIALVKKYRDSNTGKYKEGQEYLCKAANPKYGDSDAMAAYASSCRRFGDKASVREWYGNAYSTDPTNAYALANMLETEVVRRGDLSIAALMQPAIAQAERRCLDQAEVGMNMPWGYYNAALFALLLDRPVDVVQHLAKAVQCSNARFMLESACRSMERLEKAGISTPGLEWSRMLLTAAATAKDRTAAWETSSDATAVCAPLSPTENNPFTKIDDANIAIFAGSSDPAINIGEEHADILHQAFDGYRGFLVSGGTTSGIGDLVGEIAATNGPKAVAVGYLPGKRKGVQPDRRYRRRIRTRGADFSLLEPLQYWHDMLAAGVDPSMVKLIGVGGGQLAGAEYRLALALGATVAVLPGSGRAVEALLRDPHWRDCSNLIVVPEDLWTLRYLVQPPPPPLSDEMRERVAEAIHEAYRKTQQFAAAPKDPAMKPWDALDEHLKESNRGQADDIGEKLRQINCRMVKVEGRDPALATFTDNEIDTMAQMEHGRWNAQKLLDGWRYGHVKDAQARTNPCIRKWDELPEAEQKKDIATVRSIPRFLAAIGCEVQRLARRR